MFAEHIGFSIWVLWTIVVLNLGNVGITLSVPELFLLTAVPNLQAAETPAERVAVAAANVDWVVPALSFLASYLFFAGVTWFCYLRRSFATGRVPSLAYAGV